MADAPETLDMEVLCMQMIVAAGSAKSDYMEALQAVKAGDPVTMSLLLTHVEDQMMSTETVKLMVTELIDLYRKLNG